MQTEFKTLALSEIAPSLTNPRKTFNPEKLQELADSIAASGVHSPILVRPLPGSRLGDTFENRKSGQPLPMFEIVAGERRYRASKMAGLDVIPALVRHLSDDAVLEAQIVENLQRDDLTALEEAEGYQHLMTATGIKAEEIGAKIGKSRTYVYNRIKLLDMCTEGRDALRAGEIDASRAMLIARIPDHELQLRALEAFTATDWQGDQRMSYRSCVKWVSENVMLKLEDATFDITRADYLPALNPGACTSCPKRTGANPDLWADANSPDICTDPACYQQKTDAAVEIKLAELKKQGFEVIDEDDSYQYIDIETQYTDPRTGKAVPLSQLLNEFIDKAKLKKEIKITVDDGAVIKVVSRQLSRTVHERMHNAANKANTKANKGSKGAAGDLTSQQPSEEDLKDEYELAWRTDLANLIKPQLLAGKLQAFDPALMRRILKHVVGPLYEDEVIEYVFDALHDGNEDEAIAAIPDTELGPRILLALIAEEVEDAQYNSDRQDGLVALPTIATQLGIDIEAAKQPAQEAMREKVALLNVPAARAGKSAKGTKPKAKKLSPEEAQSGIANAMQNLDEKDTAAQDA